jgi:hypothetical protein
VFADGKREDVQDLPFPLAFDVGVHGAGLHAFFAAPNPFQKLFPVGLALPFEG